MFTHAMNSTLLPLAFLYPVGLLLAFWSNLPRDRLSEAALAAVVTAVTAIVAYVGFGFAIQFGGAGLTTFAPDGLRGLDLAWSPFPAGAGRWTFAGLEGFFLGADGSASSLALAPALALHRLPPAIAAGLIPVITLANRVHRPTLILAGLISSAVLYSLIGAWVWGGGWLASLGLNLNLGHGAVDVAGSGIVFFASACAAFIAVKLLARPDAPDRPLARRPAAALIGAVLFGAGWSAWALSDPLLAVQQPGQTASVALTGLVAAAAASATVGLIEWLATGRFDVFAVVRGSLAGWVAAGASAWFISPGSAALIGFVAGAAVPGAHFALGVTAGASDRSYAVATLGSAGAWSLVALGLFADGAFGSGWNGIAGGVRGALDGDPGQLTAQIAALAAIGLAAAGIAGMLFWPLSTLARRINPVRAPASPEPPRR